MCNQICALNKRNAVFMENTIVSIRYDGFIINSDVHLKLLLLKIDNRELDR